MTARHVLTIGDSPCDALRDDIGKIVLMKPTEERTEIETVVEVKFVESHPHYDFALLKADPVGQREFAHVEISTRELEEGDPVYCFGFPLSDLCDLKEQISIFSTWSVGAVDGWLLVLKPNVISAVIAAAPCRTVVQDVRKSGASYAIDRPVDFGMSGAPVVAARTGKVLGIASQCDGTNFEQRHLPSKLKIRIPCQSTNVPSLGAEPIVAVLRKHGISLCTE